MTISFDSEKKLFVAHSIFDENEKLKRSGFRWDKDKKKWITEDYRYAESLISYCDSLAVFQIRYIKENLQKAVLKSASSDPTGLVPVIYHPANMKPFPFQHAGVEYMLPRPASILADEMGLGKGLEANTLIITPYGKVKIKHLQVGNKVIGSDGKSTKVIGVFPQGRKALYRITFNDGVSILTDDEHLWKVTSRNNHRSMILSTAQLMDSDLNISLNGTGWNERKGYKIKTYYKEPNGNNKWQIPVVKPINYDDCQHPLTVDPYLLGVLLGDGSLNRNVKLELHKNDFEEITAGTKFTEQKAGGSENNRAASYAHLRCELKIYKLLGTKSNNKFIPTPYKYASINNRIALLQGLMDTDGTPLSDESSGTEYCTVSEKLAKDVMELVNSLGGIVRLRTKNPTYTYKGEKKEGQLAYRLNIKLPGGINPFRLKRKAKKYIHPTKYPVNRYIEKIEFEKYGESICIAVDAPDRLYVTEHGIVTHNTMQALIVMNMRTPVEALIICPSILKYNWLKEARKWMIGHITAYIYESKKIRYYKAQLTNHNKQTVLHIINYDILGKFEERLMKTPFNFIVADECFTYDTMIETNIGSLKIGDIVDNKLPIKILSFNHLKNKTEYKEISRYIKHKKKSKTLLRVNFCGGKSVTCTEEHKFFVNGKGYKKVSEIQSGDNLSVLRGEIHKGQKREDDSQILFTEVCVNIQQFPAISQRKNISFTLQTENTNDLPALWWQFQVQDKIRGKDEVFLLDKLCGNMENVSGRNEGNNAGKTMGKQGENECVCDKKTSRQSTYGKNGIKKNESKQSDEQSYYCGKNEAEEYWQNLFITRGEWENNGSTKEITGGVEFTREMYGIRNTNERSIFYVPIGSVLLQSGYSDSRNKTGNRSGWKDSHIEEVEVFRQEENGDIECVRVESVEILEPGDTDRYRTGKDKNICLYDIEIQDNHNYFANDILVSNCHYIKNAESNRSKITQELARKAKWKIFITGTPIYNRPKDLFVPLNLIDPIMFGSFTAFAKRYCDPRTVRGKVVYNGATKMEELNTILRANYMVRRMKKDVMKDLPDKIKDVIVLNEDGLEILVEKEKKAMEDSKVLEEKLKAQVDELRELVKTNQEYEATYKETVKNLRETRFKNFGEIARIRKELAIKKAPYVIDFVKDILDNSEDPQSKIVVFGHHTEVLEKIYTELKAYKPIIITGKVSANDRQASIKSFSEKNDTRVAVLSMGAAGTGVDGLQNFCNIIVFAELDWTPALVDQAESRLQRIGQKDTVWVYHVVANDSIDSRIVKLMIEKEAVAKEILDYRPEQVYDMLLNDIKKK